MTTTTPTEEGLTDGGGVCDVLIPPTPLISALTDGRCYSYFGHTMAMDGRKKYDNNEDSE